MNLIYPRCCVLALQGKTGLACLRIQDAEGPAHEEVRTFNNLSAELVTLSAWLATHGVTHIAIEGTNHAWKAICQELQQAFTVLVIEPGRITDVKDLERVASLLAYGLEPCRAIPARPEHDPRPHPRRKLIVIGGIVAAALLATFWVWHDSSRIPSAKLLTPAPSGMLQWQESVVSHQYPSAQPFSLALPQLDGNPQGGAIELALDGSGDRPSWLQLDQDQRTLRGVAPSAPKDRTYRLIVRARAEQGSESTLLVLLTITGQPEAASPAPRLPGHWTW